MGYDVTLHSQFLQSNDKWDAKKSIVITLSFTPGSCLLTAYKLTPAGFEWGKQNRDLMNTEPKGYSAAFYEKVQIFLSNEFVGFFMVPDNQIWNYNFIGIGL